MATREKFDYSIEQLEAIEALKAFPNTADSIISLSGPGGSGKSACINEVCNYYDKKGIKYTLSAPTNKAAIILSNYTGRNVQTIHKLLNLSPKLDVMKLDLRSLKFVKPDLFCAHSILVIDEASMVSNELYNYLTEKYDKIIAIGDSKQLAPVSQEGISKFFNHSNIYNLSCIFRQQGTENLSKLLQISRSKVIRSIPEFDSEDLVITGDVKTFLSDLINTIQKGYGIYSCSVVCYTNKRVSDYNKFISHKLFGNDWINPGSLLIGTSSENEVINGKSYYIVDTKPAYKTYGPFKNLKVTKAILSDGFDSFAINILNREELENNDIGGYIESVRLRALEDKRKWSAYYAIMRDLHTLDDIVLPDGRLVKKATINLGYAITAHKSQGSGYESVFIDLQDMVRCPNDEELRQLQYVGLSRAIKKVEILK